MQVHAYFFFFANLVSIPGDNWGDVELKNYLCLAKFDLRKNAPPDQTALQITSVKMTWKVPEPPKLNQGQDLFLFFGLQPEAASGLHAILQPVLQWGNRNSGGGDFWTLASWYVIDLDALVAGLELNFRRFRLKPL